MIVWLIIGSTYLVRKDPGSDIKKEFYSSWEENLNVGNNISEYAVEEKSSYGEDKDGNVDKWMRRSTFRIGNSETNRVKQRIEEKYNKGELQTEEHNGIIYAKVRLTNVLSMNCNDNIHNAYEFYYNTLDKNEKGNWDILNYGMDYNKNYAKGKSALNNFDNYLLIPFKQKAKNREVYVVHRIEGTTDSSGIFWNYQRASQKLKDGTVIQSLGWCFYNNNYWLEHYSLDPNQKDFNVEYSEDIVNDAKGVNNAEYEYSGVEVRTGSYNSGRLSDQKVEVANDNSDEPIEIVFYYTPTGGTNKKQYLYVKHVDQDTGMTISELSGTETFSDEFREKDLSQESDSKDYQTAYSFNADGKACGGVYLSGKFNNANNYKATVNGKEYSYVGQRRVSELTYQIANGKVSSTKLLPSNGWWLNTQFKTYYNVIIFYYKSTSKTPPPGGGPTSPSYTLTGRLAFHAKDENNNEYNNSFKNVEYVPSSTADGVNNYLIPYIEGAKRYVLPYVDESGNSTDDTQSYVKDYKEYRYVKVKGISKSGEEPSTYYNEYETTGTTRDATDRPISVDDTYRLDKNNFNYVRSDKSGVNSKDIKLSSVSLNSDGTVTFNIYGMEDGRVKHWYEYESDGSSQVTKSNPDGTTYTETTYYYKQIEKCDKYDANGNKGVETIRTSSKAKSNKTGNIPAKTELTNITRSVPVTYQITLKQKFRLENLWVYLIDQTNVKIDSSSLPERGKVYDESESFSIDTTGTRDSETIDDTYIGKIKEQLQKYYTNYLDKKEKLPLAEKTDMNDYENGKLDKYKVKVDAYNGLRFATADVKYIKYDLAKNTSLSSEKLTRNYDSNSYDVIKESLVKSKEVNENINIYTPIGLGQSYIENESGQYVNHSGTTQSGVIQKNAKFKFFPAAAALNYGDISVSTVKYISRYKVKFDFEISEFKIKDGSGNTTREELSLPANTLVELKNGEHIEGIASNGTSTDLVGQFANKYKIFAIAKNAISDEFVDIQLNKDFSVNYNLISSNADVYIDNPKNTRVENKNTGSGATYVPEPRNGLATYDKNISGMTEDSHYIVERVDNTTNLNRIYDFKITDCTDLAYKNVFRKNEKGNEINSINKPTEIYYYSGTRYWNLDTININQMSNRSFSNNFETIAPLGPYKNTDTSYIFAPKLGYRFSFDLKTTGALSTTGISLTNNKKIVITPSYYYIGKDGNGFEQNIDLYYKKTSGKYVKFINSGYTIQFRPNDGYRFLSNSYTTSDLSYMSNKLNNLNISNQNGFELNTKMMAINESGFVQSWYGEFKLPNSTIAVKSGDSPNKDNILSDGYIGVKFNIVAEDTVNSVTKSISYNTNDLARTTNQDNTTQWDYEGFLGFDQVGQRLSNELKVQLEKGIWNINTDELYNAIKGTVILYNTDDRAANDFN